MEQARPLLVVDGDNLAHRAYHSTPKSVVAPDGSPINALVGFIGMLQRIWLEEKPRAVFVGWDTLGVDTYRNKLWPAYQSGRVFDREIVQQLNVLPTLCEAFGLAYGKEAGYEADDMMGRSATQEAANGGTALILTTDKDAYQLVTDRITVISPQRGTRELERVTPHRVVEKFGVLPEMVPEFKALSGDSSDKIPGVKGIGPQSAARLLLKHGCLDNIVEEWGPTTEAQLALMFREVCTMRLDAQIELPTDPPDWASGAKALRLLGANSMADRIESLVGGTNA